MKRKTFNVLINGEIKTLKYAYNTARREIANLIKEQAQPGETWERMAELSEVGQWCRQTWVNVKTGKKIVGEVKIIP